MIIHSKEEIKVFFENLLLSPITFDLNTNRFLSMNVEYLYFFEMSSFKDTNLLCITSAGFFNIRPDVKIPFLKFINPNEYYIYVEHSLRDRYIVQVQDPQEKLEFHMAYFS